MLLGLPLPWRDPYTASFSGLLVYFLKLLQVLSPHKSRTLWSVCCRPSKRVLTSSVYPRTGFFRAPAWQTQILNYSRTHKRGKRWLAHFRNTASITALYFGVSLVLSLVDKLIRHFFSCFPWYSWAKLEFRWASEILSQEYLLHCCSYVSMFYLLVLAFLIYW